MLNSRNKVCIFLSWGASVHPEERVTHVWLPGLEEGGGEKLPKKELIFITMLSRIAGSSEMPYHFLMINYPMKLRSTTDWMFFLDI